ncbi:MAG: glycosyltransferase [Actinobacteria bacterium]|nr:glycosyltransferase [Actinomycetota bacterium]
MAGLLIVGILWSIRHIQSTEAILDGHPHELAALWVIVFVTLTWHVTLSLAERVYKSPPGTEDELDALRVTTVVPVYNEDPNALLLTVRGLFQQTRPLNRIHIVDDGSSEDYDWIRAHFWELASEHPHIECEWTRKDNGGKRSAQMVGFLADPHADIFQTIDSDVVLDPHCVEEGLKPFLDWRVASVASIILAYNTKTSIVTRLTDTWLMAFQLCVRSALSTLGSVLVNSGNSAFYRAAVIWRGLESYDNERFLGRPVQFSDDSLLTLFAYTLGRTVQQPTSFAFTVLPENTSHHLRVQMRWMRGSFIRSWWRFRYLPIWSFAYWEHFFSWLNFVLVTVAFSILFIWKPIAHHYWQPLMFLFAVLVSYVSAVKYLAIRRSDHSFAYQFGTYLMTPIMLLWTAFVLRPLRIYCMFTARKTGWGTRSAVEVKVDA